MKITVIETHIPGEAELTLRCESLTDPLKALLAGAAKESQAQQPHRIACRDGGITRLLSPEEIYYLESVDSAVFAYTATEALRTSLTLATAENELAGCGFLRISKTQIVRVCRLQQLQSRVGGGIDGLLSNGEHILISRRYAKTLRDYLKGGGRS